MRLKPATSPRLMRLALILILICLVLDQASKLWILYLSSGVEGAVLFRFEPLGRFMFIYNTGVSFSMLSQLPQFALGGLSLFITALLFCWMTQENDLLTVSGIALVIGGALGNAVDRFWLTGVVDFIDLDFFPFDRFIFNLADCAISLGVAVLFASWIFVRKPPVAAD